MTKERLKFIGDQQPKGIVEVDVKKVEALVGRGDYLRMDEQIYNKEEIKEKKKFDKKPSKSWTEKDIHKWIQENNLNIDYNIKRDTKDYALKKIEEVI